MFNKVLKEANRSRQNEQFVIILQMIDWSQAFDRQSHQSAIRSFLRNGFRSSIIPYLIDYFKDIKLRLKWNTKMSSFHPLPGGVPQGGIMGILEYLSQINNHVDFLLLDEKFKYTENCSFLKMVNLIMHGLSSNNFKQHVASDVGVHGQFIDVQHLKSRAFLDNIDTWTQENLMKLNRDKTKYMIIYKLPV